MATKEKSKYNGWTNYSTWRVNLEIFDGTEFSEKDFSDWRQLKDYAEEIIFPDSPGNSLQESYAHAF